MAIETVPDEYLVFYRCFSIVFVFFFRSEDSLRPRVWLTALIG